MQEICTKKKLVQNHKSYLNSLPGFLDLLWHGNRSTVNKRRRMIFNTPKKPVCRRSFLAYSQHILQPPAKTKVGCGNLHCWATCLGDTETGSICHFADPFLKSLFTVGDRWALGEDEVLLSFWMGPNMRLNRRQTSHRNILKTFDFTLKHLVSLTTQHLTLVSFNLFLYVVYVVLSIHAGPLMRLSSSFPAGVALQGTVSKLPFPSYLNSFYDYVSFTDSFTSGHPAWHGVK